MFDYLSKIVLTFKQHKILISLVTKGFLKERNKDRIELMWKGQKGKPTLPAPVIHNYIHPEKATEARELAAHLE